MDDQLAKQFELTGACVIRNVLSPIEISALKTELQTAVQEDLKTHPDVFDAGMVHNCMFRGQYMLKLLDNRIFNSWVKRLLHLSSVVYAYQSSSLPPEQGNFGTRIHVDCPRFIPRYMTNLGVIFPLDDFTESNGATHYLSGSQHLESLPSESDFNENSSRILANAGDMILFNGRLVHSAGINKSKNTRHALTINLCRHFMRQRFDFARMATPSQLGALGDDGKRLLGMNVRTPSSLSEFYAPESERLYKPGQE